MTSQYAAEEKKDDGILYWEPSFNGFQLPSFKKRPKMIVFDKDGMRKYHLGATVRAVFDDTLSLILLFCLFVFAFFSFFLKQEHWVQMPPH